MPTGSEFLALLEQILEVEPGDVELGSDLEELGWDSLSDLSFIAEVDTRWGITVEPRALSEAATPADLLAIVDPASAGS
jgi:acyl carrier protein